jgi:hypothetical protein
MTTSSPFPVIVGGIGGSGTRLMAGLLQIFGYYIGDDLNDSLDNLWFTLLFKRRSILLESDAQFHRLFSLFVSRMSGETRLTESERQCLSDLAGQKRLQHSRDWLTERVRTFSTDRTSKGPAQPWGCKEPNAHVVIERILPLHPDLRYIHLTRHPLDAAASRNQNQLQLWGPVFLDRDLPPGHAAAMSYWCAVHRRMARVIRQWPERTIMADFSALSTTPAEECGRLGAFLQAEITEPAVTAFRTLLGKPPERRARPDVSHFDHEDLVYAAKVGYLP